MAPLVVVSPFHIDSLGGGEGSLGAPASATWPAAGRAIYIPFRIRRRPLTVNVLSVLNGATVGNGTVQLGIYDESPHIIVSIPAATTVGANVQQPFDIPDTTLPIGLYYFGIVLSTNTDTVFRSGVSTQALRSLGCAQQASAAPLPASPTFALVNSSYLPVVGLASGPRTFL